MKHTLTLKMFLQFIFQQPIDNLGQLGNVINKKVTTKAGGIIASPFQIQNKLTASVRNQNVCHTIHSLCIVFIEELLRPVYFTEF